MNDKLLLSVIDHTGTSLILVTGSPYSKASPRTEYSYFMLAAGCEQPPVLYVHQPEQEPRI